MPLYKKALEKKWPVRFLKIRKSYIRNLFSIKSLSEHVVISHDLPLKRIKKLGWTGKYIYVEHGLSPMKYYTYKYKFFHEADLLFYPGEIFKRKMEAINPDFKNGLLGGYPKMDDLYHMTINKSALCKEYNLNPSKPIILFAPSWGGKYSKDCGINNLKYLKGVENIISIPHPADYKIARKMNAIIPKGSEGINKFIHLSDIIISDISSVLAEACLLDRAVIQIELPTYPGCFPEPDKRTEESWISKTKLNKEISITQREKRPFKLPYIDEDWILGHTCKPENLSKTINISMSEKAKFCSNRKYWAEQCCWKFDGNISNRMLEMIECFIKKRIPVQLMESS
jgi:hypothetical protein